jgi:hypothetical protein
MGRVTAVPVVLWAGPLDGVKMFVPESDHVLQVADPHQSGWYASVRVEDMRSAPLAICVYVRNAKTLRFEYDRTYLELG